MASHSNIQPGKFHGQKNLAGYKPWGIKESDAVKWLSIYLHTRDADTKLNSLDQFSSVTQSSPTLCDPIDCRTPGLSVHHQLWVFSNSCPLSWWCHPTISLSVIPFFSFLQSFPASRSFQMSQLFASGGQSIGVSASTSVLPVNYQWSPLGWTGWNSL